MKLKGVNPFERHIEKIVLGVMLLILLAVLSNQFVSRPNDVNVGSRKVSPDQVYTVLESQARQLDSQLSDQNPELPTLADVNLVDQYNMAFAGSSGGSVRLSSALGRGVDISGGTTILDHSDSGIGQGPVVALEVPMTSRPIAASMWSTLDPYAVLTVPEFEQFVPTTQPFDFPSVSIEASFNGKELESVLLGNGSSGVAIPRRYWSATGLAILGFEAQRQELLGDGTWAEATAIVTPPRTPIPLQAIHNEAGLLELSKLVASAAKEIDEVARPAFPPTIAGAMWVPPSELVGSDNDSEATVIARLKSRLERALKDLEKAQNPPSQNQQTTRPGGGKNAQPGTRGPSSRPGTRPSTRTNSTNTKLIERLEKKVQDLEEELEDHGIDLDEDQGLIRARTSRTDVQSVLEEESISLWAHDLGVEPGVTYRYRTRVVVNNPLFRKSSDLDPDDASQQELTNDPFARGEWSAWSDSVVVGSQEYFFVTGAETGEGLSSTGAKANIEMYKVFYGHYRRSTLSVNPGDELASLVRMSGDLLYFDSTALVVDEAAKAVEMLREDESSELPEGITELSNRMTIDLGVYLLDIYPGQQGSLTQFGQEVIPMQVVLRGIDGEVIVRSDLGDESSAAYALVSQSASSASKTELRAPGAPAFSPAYELFVPQSP